MNFWVEFKFHRTGQQMRQTCSSPFTRGLLIISLASSADVIAMGEVLTPHLSRDGHGVEVSR